MGGGRGPKLLAGWLHGRLKALVRDSRGERAGGIRYSTCLARDAAARCGERALDKRGRLSPQTHLVRPSEANIEDLSSANQLAQKTDTHTDPGLEFLPWRPDKRQLIGCVAAGLSHSKRLRSSPNWLRNA